jgi:hypothetical protein|tara:strand:- start:605 stop:949 length:345 start_codon:yes stop_codon:yes gene_type:complete
VFSFKPETTGSQRAARLCANQNADREHKKEQSRRRGEKKNKSTFLVPRKKSLNATASALSIRRGSVLSNMKSSSIFALNVFHRVCEPKNFIAAGDQKLNLPTRALISESAMRSV